MSPFDCDTTEFFIACGVTPIFPDEREEIIREMDAAFLKALHIAPLESVGNIFNADKMRQRD